MALMMRFLTYMMVEKRICITISRGYLHEVYKLTPGLQGPLYTRMMVIDDLVIDDQLMMVRTQRRTEEAHGFGCSA